MHALPRPGEKSPDILVFHSGALGDTVLIWPLLRALMSMGKVAYLTGASKAKLAQYYLPDLIGMDGDTPEFSRLFVPGAKREISDQTQALLAAARYVISTVSDGHDAWAENLWSLADEAHHYHLDFKVPSGREIHVLAYLIDQLQRQGLRLTPVEEGRRWTPDGPVVLHPGSGSKEKNWPLDRWEGLLSHFQMIGRECVVVLGEVELEQWDGDTLSRWQEKYLVVCPEDLIALSRVLSGSSTVISHDSGVSHLAGQMGLSVLSLFGPTHPGVWSSTGVGVKVLWSGDYSGMSWLDLERVIECLGGMP